MPRTMPPTDRRPSAGRSGDVGVACGTVGSTKPQRPAESSRRQRARRPSGRGNGCFQHRTSAATRAREHASDTTLQEVVDKFQREHVNSPQARPPMIRNTFAFGSPKSSRPLRRRNLAGWRMYFAKMNQIHHRVSATPSQPTGHRRLPHHHRRSIDRFVGRLIRVRANNRIRDAGQRWPSLSHWLGECRTRRCMRRPEAGRA